MSSHYRNIASTFRGGFAVIAMALASFGPTAQADLIGPDSYGYRADTAAAYRYEDISATGTRVLADSDDDQVNVPIGFAFDFYGSSHTELNFSPNGFISFGAFDANYNNYDNFSLLDDFGPEVGLIAPLWFDWTARGEGDAVYHQTLGTTGVDLRFVVQWRMLEMHPHLTNTGTVDFQLVLFENGEMEFRYRDVDGLSFDDANNGGPATIGMRDRRPGAPANGNVLQVSDRTANAVTNGQAIRISRQTNSTPVCDAAAASRSIVIADKAHSLVPINITGVTDTDGDALVVTINGVYQDEGVLARGSGQTCPDGGGVGSSTALIRAERVGDKKIPGNGRIYTLGFTATDGQGASCVGAVKVCVPHDTSGHRQCVEDNVVVDSMICP